MYRIDDDSCRIIWILNNVRSNESNFKAKVSLFDSLIDGIVPKAITSVQTGFLKLNTLSKYEAHNQTHSWAKM